MGKTIGLISIKGGVGKTTLSAALASNLVNQHGKKVLLIDTNYSAPNLGLHMNIISPGKTIHDVFIGENISQAIHSKYGVDVIPGNFLFKRNFNPLKLKDRLARIKEKYDFVVLDASPNVNEESLSTILASDVLFLVSTADYPSLSCAMKVARIVEQHNKEVNGIILNRVSGRNEIGFEEIQESTGIPVIARVREDGIVPVSLFERVPATLFAKDSGFSKEINKISMALLGKKENKSLLRMFFGLGVKKEQANRDALREDFYKSMFK